MKRTRHNPERRDFRGKSYKKQGKSLALLDNRIEPPADSGQEVRTSAEEASDTAMCSNPMQHFMETGDSTLLKQAWERNGRAVASLAPHILLSGPKDLLASLRDGLTPDDIAAKLTKLYFCLTQEGQAIFRSIFCEARK